jgi:hypothetical protein
MGTKYVFEGCPKTVYDYCLCLAVVPDAMVAAVSHIAYTSCNLVRKLTYEHGLPHLVPLEPRIISTAYLVTGFSIPDFADAF